MGIRQDDLGVHSFGRVEYEIRDGEIVYADEGPVGVMVTEAHPGAAGEPTLRDLSGALITVYGTDYGIHSPTWITRFTDMTRQAASYRDGRVLLSGDAAHVHYPAGGQGLNTGVQDAVMRLDLHLTWCPPLGNPSAPRPCLHPDHARPLGASAP